MYSQKLKNGKVRFFESARNPLTGEMKTFSVTMDKETNATKKAAEKALAERIRQFMLSKATVPDDGLTVGELIQTFNENRKKDPDVKDSTAKASECSSRAVENLLGKDTLVSALSAGYIKKQLAAVESMRKLETKMLPEDIDYHAVTGLRLEAQEKLSAIKPLNIGQASRISGVSPADINVLMIYLMKQRGRTNE